jgi:hypothetical protein
MLDVCVALGDTRARNFSFGAISGGPASREVCGFR